MLAYPFFHYLRRAFPDAHIASVCVPWVQDLQYRDLISEIFTLPRPTGGGFWERLRGLESAAAELKAARPWDLAISLPNSLSAAWLLRRAGAARRIGYAMEGRGLLLTDAIPWNSASAGLRAQAYLDLLPEGARADREAATFWGVPPANELDPGVPGVLERFDAEASWFRALGTTPAPVDQALEPPEGPYWVLAPGAAASSRRWDPAGFAAIARVIAAERGWPGLVVGGAGEVRLASDLCSDRDLNLRDWCGKGSVASLWKVLARAKFTVSNDSGLAHVASLCGSPVQIVWGAGDPRHTEPLGPGKVQIAMNPTECWPCERNTCLQQDAGKILQCLRGIRPETVWEEVARLTKSGLVSNDVGTKTP